MYFGAIEFESAKYQIHGCELAYEGSYKKFEKDVGSWFELSDKRMRRRCVGEMETEMETYAMLQDINVGINIDIDFIRAVSVCSKCGYQNAIISR